ncbi:hypothetical protein A3732_08535 [Oleiphilus sp. HI0050]|nr:hypothetical protein A3732_08535 [Oleiphilus sp. HI0050]
MDIPQLYITCLLEDLTPLPICVRALKAPIYMIERQSSDRIDLDSVSAIKIIGANIKITT